MKYLKTYKIFESNQSILQDIKDIFIELEDDGFLCKLLDKNSLPITDENFDELFIYIVKRPRTVNEKIPFQFNADVKDVLLRIYQYMRELGFRSQLLTNFGIAVKNFVIRPDEGFRYLDGAWIDDNREVLNIRLHFYKNFNESVRFDDRDYTDMVPRGNEWRETDNKTYYDIKSKFGIDYQDLGYIVVDFIENFDLNYRCTLEEQNGQELMKIEFFPQTNDINKLFGDTNFVKWLYSKMDNEEADDYLMYLEEIDNRLNDYNLTIRDVLPKSFRKNKEDFPYDFYAGEKYIQLWIKNI